MEVLRQIIPVYDKVNRVISLGRDEEFRKQGITGRVHPRDLILDAGSGYGNMSRVAINATEGAAKIIMYDPLPEMLAKVNIASKDHTISLSSGVFEYMPFRESIFDAVLCGYSLRDAFQLQLAISEMHRVLKTGGRLVIVDLGKPDASVTRAFVSFYLKYVLGFLAFTIAGRAGLRFRALYGTYQRWPRNSELETVLKEKFTKVEFERAMLGGAVIVAAYK